MSIRIGGTTQDRAIYDPYFDGYVSYQVDDPLDAPMELIFGPKFFDLIRFNRAQNNRSNTFAAVLELKNRALEFIYSIELGNEPDCKFIHCSTQHKGPQKILTQTEVYLDFWHYPIATVPWNETQEGDDASDWAEGFAKVWEDPSPILAAGGYAIPFPYRESWPNLPYLISEAYNESVKAVTRLYNGHLYAFSDPTVGGLPMEMQHTRTVDDLKLLPVAAALADGKPYILDFEMDAMFGGAIQIVDKTLRALSMGIQRLYYHQGTINQGSSVLSLALCR
ncbi:hypothetical protein ColTof4_11922 [Colletotrichum tofieldiae]|nr:hypothetical protein ColTof4_11922 [Colletotrichum tofieldiae]